jgi:uncharacterized integral membrane protein
MNPRNIPIWVLAFMATLAARSIFSPARPDIPIWVLVFLVAMSVVGDFVVIARMYRRTLQLRRRVAELEAEKGAA